MCDMSSRSACFLGTLVSDSLFTFQRAPQDELQQAKACNYESGTNDTPGGDVT